MANGKAELAEARMWLSMFTPERPMIVGKAVFDDLKATGQFDDLLDRVRLYAPLPL